MRQLQYLFVTTLLLISTVAFPQAKKGDLIVNIAIAHYPEQNENELDLGGVPYNINPGLGLLYHYPLTEKLFLETGIHYQYIDMQCHIYTADRFLFGEISLPFQVQYNFLNTNKDHLILLSGIYFGKFLHFDWQTKGRVNWETLDPTFYRNYSDKNFFIDLHIEAKYQIVSNNKSGVSIGTFFRVRAKENWMEHYRKNLYYGVQLGIPIIL